MSTTHQDLDRQLVALAGGGVQESRIYLDRETLRPPTATAWPRSATTPDQELVVCVDSTSAGQMTGDQTLTRIDMLIEDLRDPELRGLLHDGWQRNIDYLTALIELARRDGQMRAGPSSVTIAQLLLDTAHGSLLRAAVTPGADTEPLYTTRSLLEALT